MSVGKTRYILKICKQMSIVYGSILYAYGVLFHDANAIIISICMSITLKELGHFMVDFINKTFVPLRRTGSP